MRHLTLRHRWMLGGLLATLLTVCGVAYAQEVPTKRSSYMPVVIQEDFATTLARMTAAKPAVMQRQLDLLAARYDLSDRPAKDLTMAAGKAIQAGIRVKLP